MIMHCGVYKIENMITGSVYVGSSSNINRRWCDHRSRLRRGISNSEKLQRAWSKYGELSFEFSILETVPAEKLVEREQSWIDFYKANGKCLNLLEKAGHKLGKRGPNGKVHSEETRKKMSESQRARIQALSAEERKRRGQKSGKALRGRKLSPEHRAKCRLGRLGKPSPNLLNLAIGRKGVPRTDAVKAKVSAGLRAYWEKKKAGMIR